MMSLLYDQHKHCPQNAHYYLFEFLITVRPWYAASWVFVAHLVEPNSPNSLSPAHGEYACHLSSAI